MQAFKQTYVFLLMVFMGALSLAAHAVPNDPLSLVELTVDQVLADMKTNEAVYSQDKDKLQAMVLKRMAPHFNFNRMTQLSMGKHWGTASSAQKGAISKEFRQLLARTYANSMFTFRNEQIAVQGKQKGNERSTTVKVRVSSSSGQPVDLLLRMENRNERWQVIDVVVDGISLVITYRGAFNEGIAKAGIDGLIADMKNDNLGVTLK